VATRELRLAPGVWQARVVVRDARTDAVGSALHTFEVPAPAGLRLSSPILTDVLDTADRPRPVLKLARRYAAEGALYLQYRVFGAAKDPSAGRPRVTAAWTIRGAAGVARQDPPSPIEPTSDGTLIRLVGIGLAGLPPGDYALALRVTDEIAGTTAERTEPFTIVAES
jgi:hypothetical protein